MRVLLNLALFFVLCLSVVSAFHQNNDRNFINFMLETRSLQQRNPAVADACFKYYGPLLNEITAQYEKDYDKCLRTAEKDRDSIDDNTQPKRDGLEASATDSCKALKDCAAYKNSISYFECFANTGASNSKSMFTISADAAEELAVVRENYRLINVEQYRCTNASERVYIESSAQAMEDFSNCLKGISEVPTEDPSTITPEEDSSTATAEEDPTTVTAEDPSTVAPTATPEENPSTVTTGDPWTDASTATPEENPSTVTAEDPSTVAPTATPEEDSSTVTAEDPSTVAPTATPEEDSSTATVEEVTSTATPEEVPSTVVPEEVTSTATPEEVPSTIVPEVSSSTATSESVEDSDQFPEEDLTKYSNKHMEILLPPFRDRFQYRN